MSRVFLLLTLWVIGSVVSNAQRYINLSVDNDLYFGTDWYYSSGIFISTGKLKIVENQEEGFPKTYLHWTLGQEIYTPSTRYTRDESYFDYPYGGWLYLDYNIEKYKSPFSAWGVSLKAGATGKASLAPFFQNLYHDKILGLPDVAWEKPLPQKFHVNLNGNLRKRISLANRLALLCEFFGNLGTQRIAAGGRVGVLMGTSKALSFMGNPLEMEIKGHGVYFGTRQEYRYHDYMVSGSLFNNDAPFVLTSIPYKNSWEVGFAFYRDKWRFLVLWNNVSKDNKLQFNGRHYYLNISLGRLF